MNLTRHVPTLHKCYHGCRGMLRHMFLFMRFVVLKHDLMPGSATIPHPSREDVSSQCVGCLRIETTNPPAANTVVCTAASELDSPRKLLCPRTFHDANAPYPMQSHGPFLHSFFVWPRSDAYSDVVNFQVDTQHHHVYCCL